MKNIGIILASGTGTRLNKETPKQFLKIFGLTILERTINVFEKSDYIDSIILVINPDHKEIVEKILEQNLYKKHIKLVFGGNTRKESSQNGIFSVEDDNANVFIHDCARPFLSEDIIKNCSLALKTHSAVAVAIPATDTIIEVQNGIIKNIPERTSLMRIQTPQCFRLALIKKAYEMSKNDYNFTDDCGLIIKHNLADIHIINGDTHNIKITHPTDIYLAEKIISETF